MTYTKPLVILLALAVLVRLLTFGWVLQFGAGENILVEDDSVGYMELATNLAEGNGFAAVNKDTGVRELTAYRSIGLPLLLAPFTTIPHGVVVWGALLALIAGILLPFFTYAIGTRLFSSWVGYCAAILVAFEPHLVWYSWLPLSEIPSLLFSLGGLWLVLRAYDDNRSWFGALYAGIFFGCAILIRPPLLIVCEVVIVGALVWLLWQRKKSALMFTAIIVVGLALTLAPWSIRNKLLFDTFAPSSMGWYNVYADFLASVRAVDNNTVFHEEKAYLHEHSPNGLLLEELRDPRNTSIVRDAALQGLWERKASTIKVTAVSLISFFTNDGYFYYLSGFGFIPRPPPSGTYDSITFAFLTQGSTSAWSHAMAELKRQYYIPAVGRLFTVSIVVLALLGFVVRRSMWGLSFAVAIALLGLLSVAVGLGSQARLRLPVEPLMFLLAAAGAEFIYYSRLFRPLRLFIETYLMQLVRFAASGTIAALVGLFSTYVLTDIAGLWYLLSSFLAFTFASATAFTLQKFWTFKEKSTDRLHVQAIQTLALALFNLAFNTAGMYMLVDLLHLHYLVAQCLIYGIIGVLDFILYRFVIFRR